MKAIDLTTESPSLNEVLALAEKDNVVIQTSEGRRFVLAEIDDFAEEIAAVRRNEDLMRLLAERAEEPAAYSLDQVRKQLSAKRTRLRKKKPN